VFDPGLGQVRVGFLVSRYGFKFRAIEENPDAQKQAALGLPAPVAGLIAAQDRESRQSGSKQRRNSAIWPI
jgi:hypothetical protein